MTSNGSTHFRVFPVILLFLIISETTTLKYNPVHFLTDLAYFTYTYPVAVIRRLFFIWVTTMWLVLKIRQEMSAFLFGLCRTVADIFDHCGTHQQRHPDERHQRKNSPRSIGQSVPLHKKSPRKNRAC